MDSKNTTPLVSVIMAAYNAERYIGEAIDSIIQQTLTNWEMIIVDDYSTDRTAEIINAYHDPRIRYIRNEKNSGPGPSRNRALKECRAEYIAVLDADDKNSTNRLQVEYDYLNAHRDIAVVGANVILIDDKGTHLNNGFNIELSPDAVAITTVFNSPLVHSTVMMRKAFLEENHLCYDTSYPSNQDYELWSRVVTIGKIIVLPDILGYYRKSDTQISAVKRAQQLRLAGTLRSNLLSKLEVKIKESELDLFNKIEDNEVSDIKSAEQLLIKLSCIKSSFCNKKVLCEYLLMKERTFIYNMFLPKRICKYIAFQREIRHFSLSQTIAIAIPNNLKSLIR